MFVRRSPAIVLGLALSAAALAPAPALASDGGTAKGEVIRTDPATKDDPPVKDDTRCSDSSVVKIRATVEDDGQIEAVGVVFSDDSDWWSWKFKHNDEFSAMGQVKAKNADRSFRIVRMMADFGGVDDIFFRAENERTGEVCKLTVPV
jgi:hypothetical protein